LNWLQKNLSKTAQQTGCFFPFTTEKNFPTIKDKYLNQHGVYTSKPALQLDFSFRSKSGKS